jgi:hypothetical protein
MQTESNSNKLSSAIADIGARMSCIATRCRFELMPQGSGGLKEQDLRGQRERESLPSPPPELRSQGSCREGQRFPRQVKMRSSNNSSLVCCDPCSLRSIYRPVECRYRSSCSHFLFSSGLRRTNKSAAFIKMS